MATDASHFNVLTYVTSTTKAGRHQDLAKRPRSHLLGGLTYHAVVANGRILKV